MCVGKEALQAEESLLDVESFQDNGLVAEASIHFCSSLCLQDLVAMCPGKMCGCLGLPLTSCFKETFEENIAEM
ncbi:hypothetical protein DUI87_15238 [Hirundo rustica rustica]|uniref:Uncharacterized protein n=1 Tax=Hirundo rustica rustica TaxID=333673 RepID=A0A3M0K3B2_HIRRU|nr:hypothetical protein DUI87_15238 [Hirundo rustica rustica]